MKHNNLYFSLLFSVFSILLFSACDSKVAPKVPQAAESSGESAGTSYNGLTAESGSKAQLAQQNEKIEELKHQLENAKKGSDQSEKSTLAIKELEGKLKTAIEEKHSLEEEINAVASNSESKHWEKLVVEVNLATSSMINLYPFKSHNNHPSLPSDNGQTIEQSLITVNHSASYYTFNQNYMRILGQSRSMKSPIELALPNHLRVPDVCTQYQYYERVKDDISVGDGKGESCRSYMSSPAGNRIYLDYEEVGNFNMKNPIGDPFMILFGDTDPTEKPLLFDKRFAFLNGKHYLLPPILFITENPDGKKVDMLTQMDDPFDTNLIKNKKDTIIYVRMIPINSDQQKLVGTIKPSELACRLDIFEHENGIGTYATYPLTKKNLSSEGFELLLSEATLKDVTALAESNPDFYLLGTLGCSYQVKQTLQASGPEISARINLTTFSRSLNIE